MATKDKSTTSLITTMTLFTEADSLTPITSSAVTRKMPTAAIRLAVPVSWNTN